MPLNGCLVHAEGHPLLKKKKRDINLKALKEILLSGPFFYLIHFHKNAKIASEKSKWPSFVHVYTHHATIFCLTVMTGQMYHE